MKKLLPILLLILIGCSEPEPMDIKNLNFRNEKYYYVNSDEPYSGPIFLLGNNGQLIQEGTFKNGVKEGYFKYYNDNGQVWNEITYKDGKQDGSYKIYYDNGQLEEERTYKDRKKDGL